MRADGAAEEPCLAAAWGGVAGQRDIWPTPRQELLLRSALLPDTRALAAWRTIRMQLNPHGLDRATQGLLPAVYRNLASQGVDDQLVSGFRDVHSSVWAWNQRLLHRVLPVVGQLERAGIRTLLIKGAALIADGPFDAGLRTLNDVDVLVPTDQRADAIAVLLERGFRPIGAVPPWYVRDYAPRFVPSHAFADDLNNQIDLHWHVLHSSCQPDADDDFWAAARSIELRSVSTSALSATDELLLVILHGLRWHQVPTYRWVLDAAQLARGAYGPVDFGRLVTQARKRRVTAALRAGLSYLCRVADSPIPAETMRSLGAASGSLLERLELRAQVTDPRVLGKMARLLLHHEQHLRRELALGRRPTLGDRVRVGRTQLGIGGWRDVRWILDGGRPGPGRPPSSTAAALGTGSPPQPLAPLPLERALRLADPEVAHAHVCFGTWLPEAGGCWTAGAQARISLLLEARPATALLLALWLDAYLAPGRPHQRLEVAVNGHRVGSARLDRGHPNMEGEAFMVPRAALAPGRRVDLALDTPDAVSPAEIGIAPDDRLLGVSVRQLTLREPLRCEPGQALPLGTGSGDERFLAGGWGVPEPDGRWTVGGRSSIFLYVAGPRSVLDLELHGFTFLGSAIRPPRVRLLGNGRRLGALRFADSSQGARSLHVALPADTAGPHGELLLTFLLSGTRSPLEQGISEDTRRLGLFLTRLALRRRA